MGAVRLAARIGRKNPRLTVERLFADAFGPWPSLFRRTSWCGWRPIADRSARVCPEMAEPSIADEDPTCVVAANGVTMYETLDTLTIEVALPEMIKQSLYLELSDDILMIYDRRMKTSMDNHPKGIVAANQGHFQRFIQLPTAARSGAIRARLRGNRIKINIAKDD